MRWIGLAAGGLGRWAAVPGTRTMARAGLSPAGAVCGGGIHREGDRRLAAHGQSLCPQPGDGGLAEVAG